jgi:hypothetical protein
MGIRQVEKHIGNPGGRMTMDGVMKDSFCDPVRRAAGRSNLPRNAPAGQEPFPTRA